MPCKDGKGGGVKMQLSIEKDIEILNEIIETGWLISDFEQCTAIDACEDAITALKQYETITEFADRCKECGAKYGEMLRDMEEIREVMGCDADAETKCRMISDILTAKPQEPTDTWSIKDVADALARHGLIVEQEPKILNTLDFAIDASNGDTNYFVGFRNGLRYSKSLIDGEEPQFESCTEQEPKTGHWIVWDTSSYDWTYKCDKCGSIALRQSNYCPNCGVKMESEDKE